jgi:hypothetical protein
LFEITAVTVVNRLLEVFSDIRAAPSVRISNLIEIFHPSAEICSLKTKAVLVSGLASIKTSFERTTASIPASAPSKRLFIEKINCVSSYCLDFHKAGTTPGLGNLAKDAALLYLCQGGTIRRVWGMADAEGLAWREGLTEEGALGSRTWILAREIIEEGFEEERGARDGDVGGCVLGGAVIHFHDYDDIEACG